MLGMYDAWGNVQLSLCPPILHSNIYLCMLHMAHYYVRSLKLEEIPEEL